MTLTDIRIDDNYPTRIADRDELVDRVHPTVWGTAGDGPMDADALQAHAGRGFTIVNNMLSAQEVAIYQQELRRMMADPTLDGDERVITEKSSGEVRSIFDVHRLSPAIARLARDERILDRARQILGSDVYIHQSRVNFMPGFKGNGFYWHSDFETWHAEDGMAIPRSVSCSIALTDNHPFNGGLMLMPGSHNTYVSCSGRTPDGYYKQSLKEQTIGVPSHASIERLASMHGIEQFTGTAGSALWFDCNVMHGSGNNITPFARSNIFLVFNSVDNALQEPFAAAARRPEFIASRDFTPLRR